MCVGRKASYTLPHGCIGVVWEKGDVEWDADFRPFSLLKSLHFQILLTSAFNCDVWEGRKTRIVKLIFIASSASP